VSAGCNRCDERGIVPDAAARELVPASIGEPYWRPCPWCEPRCSCGRLATVVVAEHGAPVVLWCGRHDEAPEQPEATPMGGFVARHTREETA
jgi:hypothetical protein